MAEILWQRLQLATAAAAAANTIAGRRLAKPIFKDSRVRADQLLGCDLFRLKPSPDPGPGPEMES